MNKTRRNIIIIALAALVIIVGGVGAYLVFSRTPEERAALYMESGKEYFEKGQYVKASLDVRNALQLNDRIVEGWYLLSKISQKQNNFRAAYQLLQKTIQLDPSHVAAHIDGHRTQADIHVVTNTHDSGPGSLRQRNTTTGPSRNSSPTLSAIA